MTATKAVLRRVAASALLLLLLLGGMTAAAGQDRGTARSAAFNEMEDCLRSNRHLLLAAVIDESGSLRDSDPAHRRVNGLGNALKTLARDTYTIEVLFTGFSSEYVVHSEWLTLTPESVPRIEQEAAAYARRNTGDYTDFVRALDGAQRSLSTKAGDVAEAGGGAPCRALLLFTDGAYDIRGEGEAAGQLAVCAPDGLADQLRAVGTTIIAIGLVPGQDQSNQAFLESIADPTPPAPPAELARSPRACTSPSPTSTSSSRRSTRLGPAPLSPLGPP